LDEWTDIPVLDDVNTGQRNALLKPAVKPFDIFISMKRVEWDTLMFFYGIMLCVGGLGSLGYLAVLSDFLYQDLGAAAANILVGILSAVIYNIPIMFAVLSMNLDMNLCQWLLVTLTAGGWGVASINRFGCRCGAHGTSTGYLYLLCTPKMDIGDRIGLCGQYRRSLRDDRSFVLSLENISLPAKSSWTSEISRMKK